VGISSIPHKDIADINTPDLYLFKPLLLDVIFAGQFVGTNIRKRGRTVTVIMRIMIFRRRVR